MGFFNFSVSRYPPRAIEHDISFDLTTSYPPRKVTAFRPPRVPVNMPMEIVLSILEAAYYDDDLQSNDKLLRNCALVCRGWSAPAQKLLFRHVSLRTETAFLGFKAAVDRSTDRGRMLGDAVVRMRSVLDHNQPSGLSQQSFAHAVTLCPNLYELNLSLYGRGAPGQDIVGLPDLERMRRLAPSFDDETLSLLKSGPRITALQFSNWSENQQSIAQILDVWPSLKHLAITGTPPQLPSGSSEPFSCSLEELRMNFQTSPPLDFMKWLLHNSADTLRVLELEREPSTDMLEYLVGAHGHVLESLSIPSCASHEHALAVQKCQQLRELKIETPWASPMVYKKLPNVLQHVALGLDSDTALQPVIETVKSREYLDVVTVHIWDGGENHPQLPALKIACAYRGIELRLTRDIAVFRAMVRGDPVAPVSFPRVKSFENLQLMRSSS